MILNARNKTRAIHLDAILHDNTPLSQQPGDLPQSTWKLKRKGLRIRIANDPTALAKAHELVATTYIQSGFLQGDEYGKITSTLQNFPDRMTLLAEDAGGKAVGTITLVFDSTHGLPCDEVFNKDVQAWRTNKKGLVEVVQFAVAKEHAGNAELLTRLINFIYVFAFQVREYSHFIIEVHPRHTTFYKRLLLFKEIASTRPCPRVDGAPALLLGVELDIYRHEANRIINHRLHSRSKIKTLYRRFLPPSEEQELIRFLKAQQHAHV